MVKTTLTGIFFSMQIGGCGMADTDGRMQARQRGSRRTTWLKSLFFSTQPCDDTDCGLQIGGHRIEDAERLAQMGGCRQGSKTVQFAPRLVALQFIEHRMVDADWWKEINRCRYFTGGGGAYRMVGTSIAVVVNEFQEISDGCDFQRITWFSM